MSNSAVLGVQANQLVDAVELDNPFDVPFAEVLPLQLEAINERFQDHVEQDQAAAEPRRRRRDHRGPQPWPTSCRCCSRTPPTRAIPRSWLIEQKWDRLGKWLDTVSTNRVEPMDTQRGQDLDDWLAAAGGAGPLRLLLERHDRQVRDDERHARGSAIRGQGAAAGPDLGRARRRQHDRRMISLRPGRHDAAQHRDRPADVRGVQPPGRRSRSRRTCRRSPSAAITEMVVLRKKMADGTAKPTRSPISRNRPQRARTCDRSRRSSRRPRR